MSLLLYVEFSKLRITLTCPDFTHGLGIDIARAKERSIVNITGIYSTVPPHEHSPPQVRACIRDPIRLIVVSVFPWVVINERT